MEEVMPEAVLHLRFPIDFKPGVGMHGMELPGDAMEALTGSDPEWSRVSQELGARDASSPPEVLFVVLRGTFQSQESAKMSAKRMWDEATEGTPRAGAILMWDGEPPNGIGGERHVFFENPDGA